MIKGYSMFNAIFWGLVLVVAGILMILNYVFKLNIPVFKILVGLVLIYIGLYIIFGFKYWKVGSYNDGKTAVFAEMSVKPEKIDNEYNVIFSKGEIDLTAITNSDLGKNIGISAVFGSLVVKLPADVPVKVESSAVFGTITLPDKQNMFFGESDYKTSDSDQFIFIEASAVFGTIVFVK